MAIIFQRPCRFPQHDRYPLPPQGRGSLEPLGLISHPAEKSAELWTEIAETLRSQAEQWRARKLWVRAIKCEASADDAEHAAQAALVAATETVPHWDELPSDEVELAAPWWLHPSALEADETRPSSPSERELWPLREPERLRDDREQGFAPDPQELSDARADVRQALRAHTAQGRLPALPEGAPLWQTLRRNAQTRAIAARLDRALSWLDRLENWRTPAARD